MKKIFYIILSLIFALSLASFYACGDSTDNYGQEVLTPKEKAVYPAPPERQRTEQTKTVIDDFNMFNGEHVKWLGRNLSGTYFGETAVALYNAASGFSVSFKGSSLTVRIYSTSGDTTENGSNIGNGYVRVYVDGESDRLELTTNDAYYDLTLTDGLDGTKVHTVKMLKAVEEDFSRLYVSGITTDGEFYTPDAPSDIKIDVYGDSITAGFGILGNGSETAYSSALWDGTVTYASKVADYLDADYNVMCMQGIALSSACNTNAPARKYVMKDVYMNYSVNEKTAWDYSKFQPDIIIINLGTNDNGSLINPYTGKFNPTTETNAKLNTFISEYSAMIEDLHEKCPKAKIICCLGMMACNELYNEIADMVESLKNGGADYVYSLKLYLGKLAFGGHPSEQSNQVNAEMILEFLSAEFGINR